MALAGILVSLALLLPASAQLPIPDLQTIFPQGAQAGTPVEGRFERQGSDAAVVGRGAAGSGAFLVLSETWSLYDGWSARVTGGDGRDLPLRRAEHAADV